MVVDARYWYFSYIMNNWIEPRREKYLCSITIFDRLCLPAEFLKVLSSIIRWAEHHALHIHFLENPTLNTIHPTSLRVGSSGREDHRRNIARETFLSLELALYPRSTSGRTISRFHFSKFLARECDRRVAATSPRRWDVVGVVSRMNRTYEGRTTTKKIESERNVSGHEGSAREFAGRLKHSSAVSRPPHPKLDSSSSNESAVSVGSPSGIEGGLEARRVGRRARRACARWIGTTGAFVALATCHSIVSLSFSFCGSWERINRETTSMNKLTNR